VTILVVEDNVLNRRLVQVTLEARGHRILQAGSVEEARTALTEHYPDMVLLDVQIPGGGGHLLLEEIRRHPLGADLAVVAVTAQAMSGDRERLLASGFTGYISKPIDVRTFASQVESLANTRH
jgi:two-component system cell cycle response regulator DivK